MLKFFIVGTLAVAAAVVALAASLGGWAWWVLLVLAVALLGLGIWDVLQRKHSILRNYPVLGHLRFLMEDIRPELQQYFIERNYDGRPYDRDIRSLIYERAKGIRARRPSVPSATSTSRGTSTSSTRPRRSTCRTETPRVMIGGPDCTKPYPMALLNVSAMSFGALSANAIRALNKGAKMGGFAHDTGEGGLSPYHQEHGGDLVWEIGSGYFSTRTKDGDFDPARVRRQGLERPGQDGLAQAEPGRQARHRRRPARGQGQRRDRQDP